METVTDMPLTPYLASTDWMRGKADTASLSARAFTRTVIESNRPEGMTLTVPVTGGSSAVKRLSPDRLTVSGHGDWTRIHIGAIEAAYGREPYFQHLFPDIADVISDYPHSLMELNTTILQRMLDFIGYKENIEEIRKFQRTNPQRCADITARLVAMIDPRHSFIEPLFRLGPDTIFLL